MSVVPRGKSRVQRQLKFGSVVKNVVPKLRDAALNALVNSVGGRSASAAFQLAKMAKNAMSTPQKRKHDSKRNYGRVSGRMGKKLRTKYKVKRKGRQFKSDQLGMSLNFEYGGVLTDPYCVYIGHGTCPSNILRRIVFGAMLKKLFMKLNIMPESLTESIGLFGGTDTILVYYRKGFGETATAALSFQYSPSPAATFKQHVDTLVNSYVLARQGDTSPNIEWYFTKIEFVPDVAQQDLNFVRINLVDAKVAFYCNSFLKLQNRTSVGTDDDADDVDNQPLQGKGYFCKGSGTLARRQTATATVRVLNMFAQRTNGIYEEVSNNVGNPIEFREPPKPWHYANVSKHESIKIEPGEIRKSYLKTKKVYGLNTLMKLCVQNTEKAGLAAEDYTPLGVSRFFALEKTIEIINDQSTPTQLISVAYELNFNCGAYLINKPATVTTQEVYTSGILPT